VYVKSILILQVRQKDSPTSFSNSERAQNSDVVFAATTEDAQNPHQQHDIVTSIQFNRHKKSIYLSTLNSTTTMMKLATAFLLSAAGVASAGKSVEVPTNDIAASSPLGNRILSAARLLENNNNNNNNFSWISGYSIRFEKCATSDEYYGGYFGNNNNKNNNNRQNFNGLYQQRLVHFKLCPTGSCSASASCSNGADYVIDMNEFVDAYIDSKLTAQQYNCEAVRENCNCENANDDQACEAT